jgi:imidazole glycerol-phosphate synthase subunit HisH
MIGIIDYGMGNLRSVEKALQAVGASARFVQCEEELNGVSGIVLPGVGAFKDCVGNLRKTGLWAPLKAWIACDQPFFGICLGYQMLFHGSEEAPGVEGLGQFAGQVVRFPNSKDLKVPQMGWNSVRITNPHPLLEGIADDSFFYFVHSYYPAPTDPTVVTLETDYGIPFASAIGRSRLFATQFHPEKSQEAGLKLLKNFTSLCAANQPMVVAA